MPRPKPVPPTLSMTRAKEARPTAPRAANPYRGSSATSGSGIAAFCPYSFGPNRPLGSGRELRP